MTQVSNFSMCTDAQNQKRLFKVKLSRKIQIWIWHVLLLRPLKKSEVKCDLNMVKNNLGELCFQKW